MTIKELIARSLNGGELSPAEHAELTNFDPEQLQMELNDARSKLESLENEKLSHSERLQKELDSLRSEHTLLQDEHRELKRRCRIEKLSGESGCNDAEYFDFRARKEKIDLDDNAAVAEFTARIARESPGCFNARIAPGSSAGTPQTIPGNPPAAGCEINRISRIMDSLANAAAINE